MPNAVSTITRGNTRKEAEPLNILCVSSHERTEANICLTNHNFYAWRTLDGTLKDWNTTYAPLPNNYTLLNPHLGNRQIPDWLDLDIVLSQNKFGQYQILSQIAKQLQLPLISLEHTLPMPNWTENVLTQLKNMRGDLNLFISENSRSAWGWQENEAQVINHGINTDVFSPADNVPRKSTLLSVNNDWINREWCLNFSGWQRITKDLPTCVVGHTPGLSLPAKNIDDLVNKYRSCEIYLNTTTYSPIPTALMEAMSCECVIVSTETCEIPNVVKHGESGFLSNNEHELRKYCQLLLNDPKLCREMGRNARQTILNRFSLNSFVTNWNNIFLQASEINK